MTNEDLGDISILTKRTFFQSYLWQNRETLMELLDALRVTMCHYVFWPPLSYCNLLYCKYIICNNFKVFNKCVC